MNVVEVVFVPSTLTVQTSPEAIDVLVIQVTEWSLEDVKVNHIYVNLLESADCCSNVAFFAL